MLVSAASGSDSDSSAVASNSGSATDAATSDAQQMKDLEDERDTYRNAMIGVSAVAGVLLIAVGALIFRSVRERRKYTRVNTTAREAVLDPAWSTDAPSRHSFTDPYENTYEKH
ncbi:hypothetical protein BD626DRAFT_231844 [Schizophyllum amplum]|uniref:Uncharacterized protein n=1 Tax=Schizophyllum amplum TaxID=97359 RepID=A0A550BWB1_9AGAR|nr:hypothetical protein BD626DRAFT_231844 [Auriculariopsis ampla]